jgi:hypothetical protein
MFQGELIESQLASRCGYLRVDSVVTEHSDIHRPSLFKASWSSNEVEHFIYLGSDIKHHKYLVGKFGMRSPIAEKFSIESMVAHGHPNFGLTLEERARWNDSKCACALTYEFQRFDRARKKVEPRIFLPNAEPAYMASFISSFVSDQLLPVIQHITNSDAFLRFLIRDVEPCRWFCASPAIRAAQIVAVGSKLGADKYQIRHWLEPYERLITNNLCISLSDPKSCVDWYVDRVAADWTKRWN